jgi:hypothetical protein
MANLGMYLNISKKIITRSKNFGIFATFWNLKKKSSHTLTLVL